LAEFSIGINITPPFGRRVRKAWICGIVDGVLAAEGIDYPAEVSVLITDDETVRELNRAYRKIDSTTDVLAFAFQEEAEGSVFPTGAERVTHLGEVIVSLPQAERQAGELGHSLKRELAALVVHGVLHLLGYDHEKPEDKGRMAAREAEISARLG